MKASKKSHVNVITQLLGYQNYDNYDNLASNTCA